MSLSLNMVFSWLFVNNWRIGSQVSRAEEVEEKWHPLLSAEKKLIMYSLILALVLLAVLVFVSYTYFRTS
jgi:hypothetical protein